MKTSKYGKNLYRCDYQGLTTVASTRAKAMRMMLEIYKTLQSSDKIKLA